MHVSFYFGIFHKYQENSRFLFLLGEGGVPDNDYRGMLPS